MPKQFSLGLWALCAVALVACGPTERVDTDPRDCVPACTDKACGDDGCGGSCGTCDDGSSCAAGQCVAAETCTDEAKNGNEVDVDCGGNCPACVTGQSCQKPADCQTQLCLHNECAAIASCGDGEKNGEESDVDCGGAGCDLCATGRFCRVPGDCLSQICTNGVCRDASCTDGIKNQGEGDVDCGGPCTRRCDIDDSCGIDGDCDSGVCAEGVCATCRNDCAGADVSRCVGDQVQTCLSNASGCFEWSPVAACGAGRICNAAKNECADIGCADVPVEGRCIDASTVQYCAQATGGSTPFVRTTDCADNERCDVTSGRASCVLDAECRDGASACLNASILQICVGGMWETSACASGCNDSNPLESFCNTGVATTRLTGTLEYMLRPPNAQRTDWGVASPVYGNGFLVISLADTEGNGELQPLDAAYTEGEGNFALDVPTSPGANDALVVMAVGIKPDGTLRYAVANPGFDAAGEQQPDTIGSEPRVWSWAWRLSSLPAGNALLIREEDGSGAARVFEYLSGAFTLPDALFPDNDGLSLVTWIGYGTDWTCGACFADRPRTAFGESFESQMWIGADANESYWADAVTAHELGHWAMASFGTSPNEGGKHILGIPTFPGQAWSEGFASWFSAAMRDDSVYLDKQGGGMFWLDIASRTYGGGPAWQRPTPAGGLLQKMDENEVSAMLWQLGESTPGAVQRLLETLASPQMNTSPWPRGYTRHVWEVTSGGEHTNVQDTGISRPSLPDFLDALVCGGFSANAVDGATQPDVAYPYPSASPICAGTCSAATCSGCCVDGTCQGGTTANACGANGLQCVACNPGQTCTNGQCVGGSCDSSTCANGCCIGTTCVTNTTQSQCGTGGQTCRSCGTDSVCEQGACVGGEGGACEFESDCEGSMVCLEEADTTRYCRNACDPWLNDCGLGFNCIELEGGSGACVPAPGASSRWQVGFYSASIRVPNPADGLAWDGDNSAPDPFICVRFGSGTSVCSSAAANTAEPVWNELTTSAFASSDLANVTLELWDEDFLSHDLIDSYQIDLRSPWAGQDWTFDPDHIDDPGLGSNYAFVWVEPSL